MGGRRNTLEGISSNLDRCNKRAKEQEAVCLFLYRLKTPQIHIVVRALISLASMSLWINFLNKIFLLEGS